MTSLFPLFGLSPACAAIDLILLTSIYESHYNHINFNFNIQNLNLIWLSVLYVRRELLFISTQFFVLSLIGWFGVLSNNVFIYIPLL